MAKSASQEPKMTGRAPKQRGGHEDITWGIETARRAAKEEIGAAAELRLHLLEAAALRDEERVRRWCGRSRGSGDLL
jgi:hypothetical protein